MTNAIYQRFIKTLNALTPGISADSTQRLTILKKQGVDKYIQKVGGGATELAEVAKLLSSLEKQGAQHDSR